MKVSHCSGKVSTGVRSLDCSVEIAPVEKAVKGRPVIISLACDIMQARLIVTYDREVQEDA